MSVPGIALKGYWQVVFSLEKVVGQESGCETFVVSVAHTVIVISDFR